MGASESIIDTTIPPAAAELAEQSAGLLAEAKDFKVTTVQQSELAAIELKRVSDMERRIEETRKALKKPILEAGKAIDAFFAKPIESLSAAKSALKRAILAFDQEQERIRREEEARLRKIQQEEQERLAKEAEEAEQSGDHAAAEAIIQQAADLPPAVVHMPEAPKVAGVKKQTRWSAELVDIKALCAAVASGQVPAIAVEANMKFLNQQAVSLHEAFNIPGAKAVSREVLAA